MKYSLSDIFVCARCGYCCQGETTVSLDDDDQKRMVAEIGFDFSVSSQMRIFLAREPVDMRKSFHGLIGLTESVLRARPALGPPVRVHQPPPRPHQAAVLGRHGLLHLVPAVGAGELPVAGRGQRPRPEGIEITASQLSLILDGIDLASVRQRPRYRLPPDRRTASTATRPRT